jgi:hypothetical protein
MTGYASVTRALVAAGYVREADVEAASRVLADALVVADAQDVVAGALADEAHQEGLIADAETVADVDAEMDTIQEAQAHVATDEAVIANARNWMAAAYTNAAAALLAAELIDSASLNGAAAVIADAWGAATD